jgi:capsid protein
MPINVVMGNSSKHNYASGRLDHQIYYKSLRVERSDLEITALDRIFNRWFAEARRIPGYLPKTDWLKVPHQWMWDGNEHVDPQKEANAQDTKLKNGSTNLANEFSKMGKDWQVETDQWLKEIKYMADQLGVQPGEYLKLTTSSRPTSETVKEE